MAFEQIIDGELDRFPEQPDYKVHYAESVYWAIVGNHFRQEADTATPGNGAGNWGLVSYVRSRDDPVGYCLVQPSNMHNIQQDRLSATIYSIDRDAEQVIGEPVQLDTPIPVADERNTIPNILAVEKFQAHTVNELVLYLAMLEKSAKVFMNLRNSVDGPVLRAVKTHFNNHDSDSHSLPVNTVKPRKEQIEIENYQNWQIFKEASQKRLDEQRALGGDEHQLYIEYPTDDAIYAFSLTGDSNCMMLAEIVRIDSTSAVREQRAFGADNSKGPVILWQFDELVEAIEQGFTISEEQFEHYFDKTAIPASA